MKYIFAIFVLVAVLYQVNCRELQSLKVDFAYGESSVAAGPPERASPLKNTLKGPADLGIYYINTPGVSCGGLKTNQCSTSCGALGYPVYWCYPKVCFCHYGTSPTEDNEINQPQLPE